MEMSDAMTDELMHRHGITVVYIRRNDPSRRYCATHGPKAQYAPTEREAVLEMVEWLGVES
jgi:hypothetical protein